MYNDSATPTLSTSLVQGGVHGSGIVNNNSSVNDGGGNLNADPRFVDAAGGNLRLRQDSPAIDAGDDAAISLATDLDGLPRKFDVTAIVHNGANIVDMGAYEFNSQAVLPTADAGGPYSGNEGATIALDGSASTAKYGLIAYAWDCTDDGVFDFTSAQPTGQHCTYPARGAFSVRLLVTDTGGLTATGVAAVTVNNVAPTVSAPAAQTASEGTSKAFALGSFTDPGADGPWQVTVNWGDGTSHTVFNANSAGSLPPKSHTYATDGSLHRHRHGQRRCEQRSRFFPGHGQQCRAHGHRTSRPDGKRGYE